MVLRWTVWGRQGALCVQIGLMSAVMHHAPKRSEGLIQTWWQVTATQGNEGYFLERRKMTKSSLYGEAVGKLRLRIQASAPAVKRWVTSVLPRTPSDISCLEIGVHRKIGPTISLKHTITWSPGLGTDFERCQPLGALQMRPSLRHDRGEHTPGSGDQFSARRIAAAVLPNWADVKHNYDAK